MKKITFLVAALFATMMVSAATTWSLVTSASDLEVGATYTIASTNEAQSGYALGEQNGNNVGGVKWTSSATIMTFVLGGETDAWTMKVVGGNYLYAPYATTTGKNNYLKQQAENDANGLWTITPSAKEADGTGGATTIQVTGGTNRYILKYNSNSTLFSCYGSGQSDVYLFKASIDEDACTTNPLAFNSVSDGVLPEDDYYSINLTSLITNNGTGGEIAFDIEGENKADAFIDEDDITFKTLYAGTYTIYALQAADETYCDGEVHFTITVKAAGEGEGEGGGEEEGNTVTYAKITSAEQLEAGNYLIVYEKSNIIFDGSLTTLDATNNYQSVTISEDKIKADSKYQFTLAAIDGVENGYSIMSASGYYIGQTSDANGLKSSTTTVYTNTISFDASGNADIVSGSAYLRYNKTSGQDRFRYFKSASYSSQQAIALYKEVKGSSVGLGQLSSEVIYTEPGRVVCSGAFRIYDLLGRDVTRQNGSLSGIYVVKTATAVQKVVVE